MVAGQGFVWRNGVNGNEPSPGRVAYDIHPPKGEAYENLVKAIRSLGAWWHHLETVWIVQCAHTPAEIRDRLKSHIGTDDQLLIVDISGDVAGWVGVNDSGSDWLAQNI
jgi:hypothetical protein